MNREYVCRPSHLSDFSAAMSRADEQNWRVAFGLDERMKWFEKYAEEREKEK